MKKSKRKKMIKKLANKHFDYMDRDSQIRYVLERFYDNMSDRFLKKCYRENIGKLHWPDIFVVHKNDRVEFMINPEKGKRNPNQLMLFDI